MEVVGPSMNAEKDFNENPSKQQKPPEPASADSMWKARERHGAH